jgi:hypothetical protein
MNAAFSMVSVLAGLSGRSHDTSDPSVLWLKKKQRTHITRVSHRLRKLFFG